MMHDESEDRMLTDDEFFDKLETELSEILNIDKIEAKVYLHLVRSGPTTASAMAKELNVDRAGMYRTIDKMISTNIISTTFTSPRLCIPMEPKDALEMAVRKKEDEIKKIKKMRTTVLQKLGQINFRNCETNVPTFRVIRGRSNIYSDVENLIENANDIVYITTTLEDVSRMYHSDIPEKIPICEKNGGKVRLIVDMNDPKLADYVTRFNATEVRVGKLPSKGRIVVEKGKQMLMSDPAAQNPISATDESDFSLSTNSHEMVNNIFILCEFLWNSSKPLKTLDLKNF